MNNTLKEHERNFGLETEEEGYEKPQSERSKQADREQARQLAQYRRSLDYDSRLDFI